MSGPPYHLRKNKAADRLTFIDAIGYLQKLNPESTEYTYYGFGGSYLEDMRVIYEFHPEIELVSIEKDPEVFERQDFHRPCNKIRLENVDMGKIIDEAELDDKICIVWLDYTKLEYPFFEQFGLVINQVASGSMVKITLRADPRDYFRIYNGESNGKPKDKKIEKFLKKFENILPDTDIPWRYGDFAYYVQKMVRITAQRALEGTSFTYCPISSFYYSDGTWMLTVTGVVWPTEDKSKVETTFAGWKFPNLSWEEPRWINIPDLSTKERLFLQRFLPCEGDSGAFLREKLGHPIGGDNQTTEEALEQYAIFHRYFPYFLRGTP